MNILVVSQYFYPEDFRINDICKELTKRGHNITVLTGLPNYPEGKIYSGYEKAYKKQEIVDNIRIIRCKHKPRNKGKVNLLINYFSFYKNASKVIKTIKCDFDFIYVYQMSPVMMAIPAIRYKKKHNVPLYFYVCDIWPESIREFGGKTISTNNLIYRFFLNISKKIYKSADLIATKCDEFIDYLVDVCGVDRQKCFVNFEHAESNYLSVNEKPVNNKIVDFMFLGNLGHSSNCSLIIKSVSKLKGDNFIVHFVGNGSELEYLKDLANKLKIENKVVFHGRHPQNEIIEYYNLCDVCLLTLSNDSAIGLTPPAKLTGYMAACRPIVASINGASRKIIELSKCGMACDANDIDSFVTFLQKIIDDPTTVNTMGLNGRNYFLKNFTIEKHVDRLFDILEKGKLQ